MVSRIEAHATKATQMYRLGRIHNIMHGLNTNGTSSVVLDAHQQVNFTAPIDLPFTADLKEVQVYINTVSSQLYVEKDFHSLQSLSRGLINM